MNVKKNKNQLHGINLESILNKLVEHFGWEKLGQLIEIRCFMNDPSMKSCLNFLRKTPWARTKVENLYLKTMTPHDCSIKFRPQSSYSIMDWKNGKGKSAEIAISPSGASFDKDPFLWRLSSAQMNEGGPFSHFPGYDRYLALAKGDGLHLRFPHLNDQSLRFLGEYCHFSGDESVQGELTTGSITDLNLIFQRDRVKAKLTTLGLLKDPCLLHLKGDVAFIFAISGSLTATVLVPQDGRKWTIQEGDSWQLEMGQNKSSPLQVQVQVQVQGENPFCTLALIEIENLKGKPNP